MDKQLVISVRTILITLGLVLLAALLFQIRTVIMQLVIALILSLSIEPSVKYMVKSKAPRWLAVGIMFLATIFVFVLFITLALPVLVTQTRNLFLEIPDLINSIFNTPELKQSLTESFTKLISFESGYSVTVGVFTNTLSVITVLIFTLYLSLDLPNVKKRLLNLFSEDLRDFVDDAWVDIEKNLSLWVKGQLLLMFAVGISSYIGLLILGIPYAFPLAIISGLLEIVPVLGPIITTVIAAVVGFSISPITGLLVLALFLVIQQFENGFLVPRIMQKIIGFNPLVTMIALQIGGKLFGIVGAVIAIPLALIIVAITHRLINFDLES